MTSPNAPRGSGKVADLVSQMLFGAVVFGVLGALASLIEDVDWRASATGYAAGGLLIGVGWYWQSRRAFAYRSTFDIADRTLTRATATVDVEPRIDVSRTQRYRNRKAVILFAVLVSVSAALVLFLATLGPEIDLAGTALLWSLAVLPGLLLVAACLTYVDVGPGGLMVRNVLREHRISWTELAEVGWHRSVRYDVLLLSATDGRRRKAHAVVVTDTGWGSKRADRLLRHIKQTWSESL